MSILFLKKLFWITCNQIISKLVEMLHRMLWKHLRLIPEMAKSLPGMLNKYNLFPTLLKAPISPHSCYNIILPNCFFFFNWLDSK